MRKGERGGGGLEWQAVIVRLNKSEQLSPGEEERRRSLCMRIKTLSEVLNDGYKIQEKHCAFNEQTPC